jgi:hypothetical protein
MRGRIGANQRLIQAPMLPPNWIKEKDLIGRIGANQKLIQAPMLLSDWTNAIFKYRYRYVS